MSEKKEVKKPRPFASQKIFDEWKEKKEKLVIHTLGGKYTGTLVDMNMYEMTIIPEQEGRNSQVPMVIFKGALISMVAEKNYDKIKF